MARDGDPLLRGQADLARRRRAVREKYVAVDTTVPPGSFKHKHCGIRLLFDVPCIQSV